jgi:hypothetical protein
MLPLCRWPFPRLCGFSLASSAETFNKSFGRCSLRVSPPYRASPGETWPPCFHKTAPLMGFFSLQHIRARRSTCHELCLLVTFRPQGLVTLSTVYSLRIRAGFVSHRQRSWDLPFGAFSSQEVFRRFHPKGPTYRSTKRFSQHPRC